MRAKRRPFSRQRKWSVVESAAGMAAAVLASRILDMSWKRTRGRHAPTTPGVRGVTWRRALLWSAVSGAIVAAAQLAATGAAAAAWKRTTGRKPPKR